jgi:hypothetical protein
MGSGASASDGMQSMARHQNCARNADNGGLGSISGVAEKKTWRRNGIKWRRRISGSVKALKAAYHRAGVARRIQYRKAMSASAAAYRHGVRQRRHGGNVAAKWRYLAG